MRSGLIAGGLLSSCFFAGRVAAAILARTASRAICCVLGSTAGGLPIFALSTSRAFSASSGVICCVFWSAAGGEAGPIFALTAARTLSASSGDSCCVFGSAAAGLSVGAITCVFISAGLMAGGLRACAACSARTFCRAWAASSLLRIAVLSTGVPDGALAADDWPSGSVPVSFFSLSLDARRFGGLLSSSGGTVGKGYQKP
jgi:hypothetical protein